MVSMSPSICMVFASSDAGDTRSSLRLMTFRMKRPMPLRLVATGSNLTLFTYG